MRRYLATVVFAGAAFGAAPLAATPSEPEPVVEGTTAVAVQQTRIPSTGLRDEAAMVLVGTALIGLAAAVRRAA